MRPKLLSLSQVLFLAGFAALLCAPFLGWLLKVRPPESAVDLRKLAEWPAYDLATRAAWPAKFDAWLNDHFPLRAHIIRLHSLLRHRWLGAPSSTVLVGKSGWLYYTGDRTLEDFVGRDPLSEAELARWHDHLEGRRAWLAARGIRYLFVIVPNKSTIVTEMMPTLLQAQHRPGKLDQLLAYLRARQSTVPILDLRETMAAAHREGRGYWRFDSHWSGDGLVAATQSIAARINAMDTRLARGAIAGGFAIETSPRDADCIDLLAMREAWRRPPERQALLSAPDLAPGQSPLLESPLWKDAPWWKKPVTSTRASGTGRAVLFSDSFFRAGGVPNSKIGQTTLMLPFARLTTLWEWPTFEQLQAAAEAEQPDIIIEQWTERFLKVIPADHPELARAREAKAP